MAKDPAFLFYSSDFLAGIAFFSDEQVGQYIKLLCLQHQQGHLYEKDMLKICKTHDKDIFSKFKRDADGLYYNERLENEVVKRKAYSKSRSENRKKRNICNSYVPHMENENENSIGNEGLSNTNGEDFENSNIAFSNLEHYKNNFLKDSWSISEVVRKGVNPGYIRGWLEAFNKKLIFEVDTLKTETEYRKHFTRWLVKVPSYTTADPEQIGIIHEIIPERAETNTGDEKFRRLLGKKQP